MPRGVSTVVLTPRGRVRDRATVWKVRGYTHPQADQSFFGKMIRIRVVVGRTKGTPKASAPESRLLSSGPAWVPTGGRSPLVPARCLSWVRRLVKEGSEESTAGRVEQKPSWTGIWFKVECSLRRRVTVRPWNPGNGGNLSEGDKEYNMGDETKRPTV